MVEIIDAYGVQLIPVCQEHLEQLRIWRNSPAVSSQMVSQEQITATQQQQWFQNIQKRNDQQHFAIYYRENLIGAANVKSSDGSDVQQCTRLEPGIYIGDERYRSNILAFAPSLALLDYCFETLNVDCLQAKVRRTNQAALSYNHKLGYVEVDKDESFAQIELTAEPYQDATRHLKSIFLRNRNRK